MCLSRRTEGVKGFYTTVFDDVEGRSLLAYFTPTGKACCYYPSGAIHMLCDREGGSLYSEVSTLGFPHKKMKFFRIFQNSGRMKIVLD